MHLLESFLPSNVRSSNPIIGQPPSHCSSLTLISHKLNLSFADNFRCGIKRDTDHFPPSGRSGTTGSRSPQRLARPPARSVHQALVDSNPAEGGTTGTDNGDPKLPYPSCVSKPDTQTWINALCWPIKHKKRHFQARKVDRECVSLQHTHSTIRRKVDETLHHLAKPLCTALNSSEIGLDTACDSKASKAPKDNIVSEAMCRAIVDGEILSSDTLISYRNQEAALIDHYGEKSVLYTSFDM